MRRTVKVAIISVLAVVALDYGVPAGIRALGFKYSTPVPVTLLMFFAVGFFAAKYGNLRAALGIGALVGFADMAIAWATSPIEGAEGPTPTWVFGLMAFMFVGMTLLAIAMALLGALLARFVSGRTAKRLGQPPVLGASQLETHEPFPSDYRTRPEVEAQRQQPADS